MEVDKFEPGRILILGDGNFSFSLALSRYNISLPKDEQFKVLATSFDDRDSLIDKYPETRNVLQLLTCRLGCTVLHSINATQHLQTQLQSNDLFQHIIFNFPHLGVEDAYSHSHLVGHIFFRCLEAIHPSGNVYISLAEGQAQRWRLKEIAAKNGFELIASGQFLQQQLPGYEMKRHQTGRSFMARLEDTHYYMFRKSKSVACFIDVMGALLAAARRDLVIISEITPERDKAKLSHDKSATADLLNQTKNERNCKRDRSSGSESDAVSLLMSNKITILKKDVRGKRRMAVAENGYHKVNIDSCSFSTGDTFEYECKTCSKKFKLEQGARTHVYMMHIIGQSEVSRPLNDTLFDTTSVEVNNNPIVSESKRGEKDVALYCPACAGTEIPRHFPNQEALYQHMRAKHGNQGDLLSSTEQQKNCSLEPALTVPVPAEISPQHSCPACDLYFASEIQLQEHIDSGISPPAVIKVQCERCRRFFQNERGLKQHFLSCIEH